MVNLTEATNGPLVNGYHNGTPEVNENVANQNENGVRPPSVVTRNQRMDVNRSDNSQRNILNQRTRKSREESRVTGTVKWFNAKNGYGFITRHDTAEDVFVHCTGISKKNPRHFMKSLGDGEIVEFNTLAVNVTGPRGTHVRGNPYVSFIPIRTNDIYAAGDNSGVMRLYPVRRFNRVPPNYGDSRIPRWNSNYRNQNF